MGKQLKEKANKNTNLSSVNIESVEYLCITKEKMEIFIKDGKFLYTEKPNFKQLSLQLEKHNFLPINHNTIINKDFITQIDKQKRTIEVDNYTTFRVSRRKWYRIKDIKEVI